MINNLKRGDKIVTSGGIVGTITKVNDNKELQVQISENTEIKLAPGMVAELYLAPEVLKNTNTSSNILKNASIVSPQLDCEVLLSHVLKISRENMLVNLNKEIKIEVDKP